MLSLGSMIRKSQPTLFWCMRSLPKPKREAIFTLFAFCRHLDSVSRSNMPEKEELLKAWREELDNIYDKKVPATNIGRKIYKNCLRFNLPKDLWIEILNGAFLNVKPMFAPSIEVFEQYIHGVAEVPFKIALMIIDPEHPKAGDELAKNLGQAVLLTYILRDIKDDAKAGYVYIPTEVLKQANIISTTAREILEHKNLALARAQLSDWAEKGYIKAERLLNKMNYTDTGSLRMIYNLCFCQFEIMKKRGWEIISPKPKVNFIKRLNIFYHIIFG